MCCARWTRNGYITDDAGATAAATPLGTIRYGSNEKFRQQGGYFMEEVRRELIKQFGEKAEEARTAFTRAACGCALRWIPMMQDAAAEALREGLARFDGGPRLARPRA